MASIKKYKTAKGTAWRVQYRSPDGKSRTKQGFKTKDAASAWADRNAVSVREGEWIDPALRKLTVDELGARWLANQTHLKPSTLRTTEQAWRVHVQPQWAHWQIGAVKPSDVQTWVSGIDRAGATVRRAHACLAQILDVAVMDGMLKSNPARGVTLPRKAKAKHVYLTAGQVKMLADECSSNGELVWLLATTGLRWGEAAALRVEDVDFLRRRIRVERAAVTVGSDVHVGTPKTHEKRSVAVPAFVLDKLSPLCAGKLPGALLWTARDGDFMKVPNHHTWYYYALDRVRRRELEFPRVNIHGLRHVAAGLLVSQGANVKVVQRQLGHANASMTLDVYADLFEGDLDAVGASMDEAFRGVV